MNVVSLLDGFFVGTAVSFLVPDNSWDKYDMEYATDEVGYKFELGNVWSVSEHYFVGITLNTAIYWSGVGSNKEYGDDEFQVYKNSKRDPVEEVNTLQLHWLLVCPTWCCPLVLVFHRIYQPCTFCRSRLPSC